MKNQHKLLGQTPGNGGTNVRAKANIGVSGVLDADSSLAVRIQNTLSERMASWGPAQMTAVSWGTIVSSPFRPMLEPHGYGTRRPVPSEGHPL